MKHTRNIHRPGCQAGLVTALALSGLLLAGVTRASAGPVPERIQDGDFEEQTGAYVSSPWTYEVKPYGGSTRYLNFRIESGRGTSYSGVKNVKIVPTVGIYGWYGIAQRVTLGVGSGVVGYYRLTGYVRCSANCQSVYLGVRSSTTGSVIKQSIFGGASTGYRRLTVTFAAASADSTVVVFAGCNYSGGSSVWLQIDNLSLGTFFPFNPDLVDDSGFENQPTTALNAPWLKEGTGTKGVDLGTGPAATGTKNAYIRATSGENAITQMVAARDGKLHVASAKVYTSPNFPGGYLGVRDPFGREVAVTSFGRSPTGYTTVTTPQFLGVVGGGDYPLMMTLFVRYTAPGADSWVRVDDVHMWIPGRTVDP